MVEAALSHPLSSRQSCPTMPTAISLFPDNLCNKSMILADSPCRPSHYLSAMVAVMGEAPDDNQFAE